MKHGPPADRNVYPAEGCVPVFQGEWTIQVSID